jgi:hypothetical protein
MGSEGFPFSSIIIPLSAALGLSLIVERVLEFTKNIFERVLGKREGRVLPDKAVISDQIEEMKGIYEKDKNMKETEENAEREKERRAELIAILDVEKDLKKRREILKELTDIEKACEWDEQFSDSIILVEDATDPDDGRTFKALSLQLLGFALGIILVHFSGIQLFKCFLEAFNQHPDMPASVDYLLTGLLIGGGSKPMHILVRFVTQRKITSVKEIPSAESEDVAEQPAAPAIIKTPSVEIDSGWIDIPYFGGVDREKLELVHKRPKDPDIIIYHHTAMNSRSTFSDIVGVIKSKKDSKGNSWITGYNCCVMADGSIYPFCRWDRYGNHAAGHNRRSLGLAFNGNFETDPEDSSSNHDGRMGPAQPTDLQMKAGARVIALWTFLYSIEPDFKYKIIPHRNISTTACPGSQFPKNYLEELVTSYRERWLKSNAVLAKIEDFKKKPFVYV